jgi:hypothetical protein
MRSGRSECASQPNPVESIELGTIEQCFRDQVEHILGWRLLESPGETDGRRSPPPMRFSPFAGADTVPPPSELAAEVTLVVSCRLLKHRSGSSSVVLELSLDHREGCIGPTCTCRPKHTEALNWLIAHFSRHSSLRLVPAKPAVKVQLEPLSGVCTPQNSWHDSFQMSNEMDEMDENLEQLSKEHPELAPVPEAGPVEEQGRERHPWEATYPGADEKVQERGPVRRKMPATRRRSPHTASPLRTGSPPRSQSALERGDELFEAVLQLRDHAGTPGRGYGRAMRYTPTYFPSSARSTPTQQRKRRAPLVGDSFSHRSGGPVVKTTRSKSTSAWMGSRTHR